MGKINETMLVLNGTVFLNGRFEKKDIRIENGKFAEIAEPGKLAGMKGGLLMKLGNAVVQNAASAEAEQVLDATGKYILPGLVDVHTHGRTGLDFSKIAEEDLEKLLSSYGECGVTSVLATTMTNDPAVVEESLRVMGEYIRKQETKATKESGNSKETMIGAKLLGIHMEGPFLGKEKKGAHDEKYLQNPDWTQFEKWQQLSGENIRLITIDPTLNGAEEFIKKCVASGVKVSLGHTACDYETAIRTQKLGADHVTHTFNAMNPLHHREPGIIGAALDTGMTMELICDGIHVHPAVVRLLFAAHPEQMVLVSDSIPAAGVPDGEYVSGGLKVTLENGKALLADGTIAGSVISLFDAMVNAIKFGVPAEAAVNSATYLPAKSIGMEDTVGSIAVERTAEFLVVDSEWKLEKVYRG